MTHRLTRFSLGFATLAFVSAIFAQPVLRTGWRSNPNHAKMIGADISKVLPAEATPPFATLEEYLYATSQGDAGACVAFTAIEAVDALQKKNFGAFVNPSPLDMYYQLRVHDNTFPADAGSYTASAKWVLTTGKICRDEDWRYSAAKIGLNPPSCAVKRRNLSVVKAYDVPADDNGKTIMRCVSVLRVPVLTGGYWFASGMTANQVTATVTSPQTPTATTTAKRFVILPPKGQKVGGHEVLIVGYDRNMVYKGIKGWVQFHNHWALSEKEPWGDERGCAWAPMSYLCNPTYFEDNCAFVEVSNPKAKK